jgi:hypothetical protein
MSHTASQCTGLQEYRERAAALQQWKMALQKGRLPDVQHVTFPIDPFKSKFAVCPATTSVNMRHVPSPKADQANGRIAQYVAPLAMPTPACRCL